ncbi:MAG: hypothetical protein JNK25_02290 [Phycisphaerae bacterium]|nr:hypothetical protein [Phycisphaerae bacterium]
MPNAAPASNPVRGNTLAATPRRSITREHLIEAGRTGLPGVFLPMAASALAQVPGDHLLRVLFAAHLARLGLRTLAEEQLVALSHIAGDDPNVRSLSDAVASLPPDRVALDELGRVLSINAAALEQRGIFITAALREAFDAGAVREWFRRVDGHLVSRKDPQAPPHTWTGLGIDTASMAASATRLAPDSELFPKPIVLHGLSSIAHLTEAFRVTSRETLGYRPRLSIVESNLTDAVVGLYCADLTRIIEDPRTEWFIGPDAIERFTSAWSARLGCTLPDSILNAAGSACPTALSDALEALHEEQGQELRHLHGKVTALYASRDRAWWGRRYRETDTKPLRVLVLTSRFSTFVRHSAADVAGALKRCGCEVKVHQEPDTHSRDSTLGTLRTVDGLEPDLVILINFPRSACGAGVPANVPFVTWVQDSMPHLLAPCKDTTPLDFTVGHLLPEFFEAFGYDRSNALPSLIVADAAKFHPSPHERRSCDIAFVSHHSEPPEAMHTRLVREAAGAPAIQRTFETLLPDVTAAVRASASFPPLRALRDACVIRLCETLGREPEARTLALVLRTYAAPLADRLLRHETLHWAADCCRRHGWRMRLYGGGWERAGSLAEYAAGTLTHDHALRDAYQSAALHLHISLSALVHQRLLECFLSGGFCAARHHRDALSAPKTTVQAALLRRPPDVIQTDRIGYVIADHPEAMRLSTLRARLGYPDDEPVLWISRARADSMRQQGHTLALDHDLDAATGDMSALVFRDATELEALAKRVIEQPPWRSAVSSAASVRIRCSLSYDAFASRLLTFLTRRLNGEDA